MTKNKEDCKDPDEPFCKFVNITKYSKNKTFCAIIHGKYNDFSVKEEVINLINATSLDILPCSTNKNKYNIYFLFIIYFIINIHTNIL